MVRYSWWVVGVWRSGRYSHIYTYQFQHYNNQSTILRSPLQWYHDKAVWEISKYPPRGGIQPSSSLIVTLQMITRTWTACSQRLTQPAGSRIRACRILVSSSPVELHTCKHNIHCKACSHVALGTHLRVTHIFYRWHPTGRHVGRNDRPIDHQLAMPSFEALLNHSDYSIWH